MPASELTPCPVGPKLGALSGLAIFMNDPDPSRTRLAELHSHSDHSDGSFSPEKVVEIAHSVGLAALALTDHDTVSGISAARKRAEQMGLSFIAGVEFSSHVDKQEIHILGLFIDDGHPDLIAAAEQARLFRRERAHLIVGKLRDLHLGVDFSDVESAAGTASMGRPHIAAALVTLGAVPHADSAFQKYIGNGGPAFVPKPTLSASEVIDTIHAAGGVAVLAHPASSRVGEQTILDLADIGLDGFEVLHPKHRQAQQKRLCRLIDSSGLLPSGGSDFHGPGSARTPMGACAAPLEWMEALRQRAAQHALHVASLPKP
jgi:predicted metal-dependent phosphoesterase TrpH